MKIIDVGWPDLVSTPLGIIDVGWPDVKKDDTNTNIIDVGWPDLQSHSGTVHLTLVSESGFAFQSVVLP